MRTAMIVAALLTALAPAGAAQEEYAYVDLIGRLTDLARLATLPAPEERCAQWSSYDRGSIYDESAGKYVGWDANGDGGAFIRQEEDQFVFAEIDGPGVIWRIWSAAPKDGHVRVYLDGAEAAAIDLPFKQYFDNSTPPFNRPSLCYSASSGWNCYVPIPFQKSCRITADAGWGAYYHFTYATYPKGTKLPTFSRDLTPDEDAALDAADRFFEVLKVDPLTNRPAGEDLLERTVKVKPGASKRVATLRGPQAITGVCVSLDLPESPADRKILRELALEIRWDGESNPSVWCPLGDFFGTAAGANAYSSFPMGLTKDGRWYSCWYMPFASSAEVRLINDGAEPRTVSFEIAYAPLDRSADNLGRFHAKWHRDALLPKERERWIDWPLVRTEGRGRFCGVMLHIWNPKGGWWGEGDEKFFVDGEKFPSTFGTGSEDYFGYAWGNPGLFTRPYHNQTISMGNRGHISVNRWQITDNIPFQEGFEGCIEKYFKNDRPTLYAAVAYWYLAPGGEDPYEPASLDERIAYCSWEGPPKPKAVEGAIEGETLDVIGKSGGNARTQELGSFGGAWSCMAHLWWTDGKPGDRLELALPVEKAGRYRLDMQFTRARDYGIVQVYLDGTPLMHPIDLYHPDVLQFGPFNMGTVDLSAGDHVLALEITGANPNAVPSYMAGLDYVRLVPAGK